MPTLGYRMGAGLAVIGSGLVVAFSWAPFIRFFGPPPVPEEDRLTWAGNVWSELAFTGPLRAAVGLSALAALLSLAGLVTGRRVGPDPVMGFATGSSAAILAGYMLSRKFVAFEATPKEAGYLRNGWGAYAMFAAAWLAFAVVLWNAMVSPSRRRLQGDLLGDLVVFAGAATVAYGSTQPFLISRGLHPEFWSRPPPTYGAWAWHTFTAPLTWSVVIAAVLAFGLGLMRWLRPSAAWPVWQVYLTGYAALVMVGYALSAKSLLIGIGQMQTLGVPPFFVPDEALLLRLGFGGWLMLVGCAVAFSGAVLSLLTAPRVPDTGEASTDGLAAGIAASLA